MSKYIKIDLDFPLICFFNEIYIFVTKLYIYVDIYHINKNKWLWIIFYYYTHIFLSVFIIDHCNKLDTLTFLYIGKREEAMTKHNVTQIIDYSELIIISLDVHLDKRRKQYREMFYLSFC